VLVGTAAAAATTPTLRTDGIGPLRLGMARPAALATGWLGMRGTGCELGRKPYPVTYRFAGPKAPAGIDGVAQFDRGKLSNLSFTKGVRTARGTTPGTTRLAAMAAAYKAAGYHVSSGYDHTFGGTFVTVKKGGRQVLGAFGERRIVTVLALPDVPVCD
jgi:hypothetical protein